MRVRWLFAIAAALLPAVAQANDVEDFYKGKTIDLYIGYSAGGGYDTYARMVAHYMGKYIPGNPTIVPKNMPGAGSLRLTNWLFRAAPQDGTAFGAVARAAPLAALFGDKSAQFKAEQFNYIGSANNEVSVCVARTDSGISTFEDLKTKQLVLGGNGGASDPTQMAKALQEILGAKIKIIDGYPGGNDIVLAMERNEVQGRCGWSWSTIMTNYRDWIDNKRVNVLVQMTLDKNSDLPNVPRATDLALDEKSREVLHLLLLPQEFGRPFIAPPNVPPERVEALRKAFMQTLSDPAFIADAAAAKLEVHPSDGEKVQALVKEAVDSKPETIEAVSRLLQ